MIADDHLNLSQGCVGVWCCWFNILTLLFLQVCNLTLGSWTMDYSKVRIGIITDTANLDSYVPNGEWDLIAAPLSQEVKFYNGSHYNQAGAYWGEVRNTFNRSCIALLLAKLPMFPSLFE